ncbi:hypothetical protein EX30DRAFT_352223 [Ascodesmis nigricans]|uniref:Uncharacterized protein n=1 Tax=Ascodesmis nigricans TaxID=341454 RepID=A0A4S2MJD0_9PEZI|nr:hypothetical protein EX30DRAFT_352223 [Ascodesmis nigricans]
MQLSLSHLAVLVIAFTDLGFGQPTKQPAGSSFSSAPTLRTQGPIQHSMTRSGRESPPLPYAEEQMKWRLVHRKSCGRFLGLDGFDKHLLLAADESITVIQTAAGLLEKVIKTPVKAWKPTQDKSKTLELGQVERKNRREDALLAGIRSLGSLLFGIDADMTQRNVVAYALRKVSFKRSTRYLTVPNRGSSRIYCGDKNIAREAYFKEGKPKFKDASADLLIRGGVEETSNVFVSPCQQSNGEIFGFSGMAFPATWMPGDSLTATSFNAIYLCETEFAASHHTRSYNFRASGVSSPHPPLDLAGLMEKKIVPLLKKTTLQNILYHLLHYTVVHEFMHMRRWDEESSPYPANTANAQSIYTVDVPGGYGWDNCVLLGASMDKKEYPIKIEDQPSNNADSHAIFAIGSYMLNYMSEMDEKDNPDSITLRFFTPDGKLFEKPGFNYGKGEAAHFIDNIIKTSKTPTTPTKSTSRPNSPNR